MEYAVLLVVPDKPQQEGGCEYSSKDGGKYGYVDSGEVCNIYDEPTSKVNYL